jgi:hypothetical protein
MEVFIFLPFDVFLTFGDYVYLIKYSTKGGFFHRETGQNPIPAAYCADYGHNRCRLREKLVNPREGSGRPRDERGN